MKNLQSYDEFLNEAKQSAAESRAEKLSKDPKLQKSLGAKNAKDLEYALMAAFLRGYGAAISNWGAVRPHIKKLGKPAAFNAWGNARMTVFTEKGTAYKTADKDIADWLKGKGPKPKHDDIKKK